MSATGYTRAQLEAMERERIRRQQVVSECRALVAACEEELANVRDRAVQQLAAPALKPVRASIEEWRGRIMASPDEALTGLRAAGRTLQCVLVEASSAGKAWNEQQKKARAGVAAARVEARVVRQIAGTAADSSLAGADAAAAEAEAALATGRFAEAEAALAQASAKAESGRSAAFDESVRRAIVSSLFQTLQAQGFVTAAPELFDDGTEGGTVTLIGQLPSGRRARFDVHIDGRLGFDLDGYEGRACAADLESVETALLERFNVRLGPPQMIWKNPDKISKGARDLPSGGQRNGQGS